MYGGTSIEVEVTYMPLAIETDNATLSVYTNVSANPFIIPLDGIGIGAPTITPTPASLEVTLTEGDTANETLTITNTGLGTLDFTVELGLTAVNMLIYADPNWDPASYDNILNIINSTIPNDLSITQTYTADAAEMENLLQQNDILLLPTLFGINIGFPDSKKQIIKMTNITGLKKIKIKIEIKIK